MVLTPRYILRANPNNNDNEAVIVEELIIVYF